jgi:hypothetical protein
VAIKDLNLSERQKSILIEMVGMRYKTGNQTIRLISDQFPNRIENKRYLIVLLENLLLEARRLSELNI